MKRVILASASPRRRELLSLVGVVFEIIPSTEEENCAEAEPEKLVETLARKKAENVAEGLTGDYYNVVGLPPFQADERAAAITLKGKNGYIESKYFYITVFYMIGNCSKSRTG